MKLITPASKYRILGFFAFLFITAVALWSLFIRMPGKSFSGALPPLTGRELALSQQLRHDVFKLAGEFGVRNPLIQNYASLMKSADFLQASFEQSGYTVRRQTYDLGREVSNLIVELPGTAHPDEIVVIGAHYDSVLDSPGANDNATGAAAVLALARFFSRKAPTRTLRFVEFVCEEPPYFQTNMMGSLTYAQSCAMQNENIVAMLSLETLGCYLDKKDSQKYPLPILRFIYPSTGNYIAFVSNTASRKLTRQALGAFRRSTHFPSEGIASPELVPGIGWSDHWSFWQQGYSAVMVTDTAPFRYPQYHMVQDTPDRVDYELLARVVAGLEKVVAELSGTPSAVSPPPQGGGIGRGRD